MGIAKSKAQLQSTSRSQSTTGPATPSVSSLVLNSEIVRVLVDRLNVLKAYQEEGIFRISGSSTKVETLASRFASVSETAKYAQECMEYDVADSLKWYLGECISDRVLTAADEQALTQASADPNEEARKQKISSLIQTLRTSRPQSFRTLQLLLPFLSTVAQNSQRSKMTAETLALIFAPGLFPLHSDPIQGANQARVNAITELITNCHTYVTV